MPVVDTHDIEALALPASCRGRRRCQRDQPIRPDSNVTYRLSASGHSLLEVHRLRNVRNPRSGSGGFSLLADFQREEENFNLLPDCPVTVTSVLAAGEQSRKPSLR